MFRHCPFNNWSMSIRHKWLHSGLSFSTDLLHFFRMDRTSIWNHCYALQIIFSLVMINWWIERNCDIRCWTNGHRTAELTSENVGMGEWQTGVLSSQVLMDIGESWKKTVGGLFLFSLGSSYEKAFMNISSNVLRCINNKPFCYLCWNTVCFYLQEMN